MIFRTKVLELIFGTMCHSERWNIYVSTNAL